MLVQKVLMKERYHIELAAGENGTGEDKKALPPSLVFEPPPEEAGQQQHQEGSRMPKTSLPARMSDLYQVVEQVSKNHVIPRATPKTPRRW